METNRLQRLLNIIDTALSLQPGERVDYVHEACGEDTELRNEVQEILKSVDDSETFWENWQQWNDRWIKGLFQDQDNGDRDIVQEMIGPWRLVKLLGTGGMGVVYLAERADGSYYQKTALKLLRLVYKHRELEERSVHRFQQERQILARLNHPNIARLYDGGYTGEGLPWLAMEYIDGLPITDWCRQNNSSLDQRLDLFKKICDAIRYAHKNLIVHRDLKPENILVTRDGQVKILDFGIAKLLDEELSDAQQALTQTGIRAMSLYYAAPEQITGEPITTATDVYALGLLLYELIAGDYPFKLQELNQRQIEHIIRNEEPVKPSALQKRDVAMFGGNLSAGKRDDLDAITLKALRKEPDQRYENAGDMLDDIFRYQNNVPLIARRDTVRYRLSKFIKRHNRSLSIGVAIMMAMIGLTAYYTWQLTNERDIAQREAARADQVSKFLADMFIASDPSEARGENITARELLHRGAERVTEFTDLPEVQASMMQLIGRVYWSIGSYEEALPLLEQAIEIRQEHSDNSPAELALSHYTLGVVLHELGDYRRAVPHFEHAVDIFRMDPDHISPEYATSLENMGYVEDARRNYKNAEELHQEALRIRLSLFGPDHPDVAQSHYSIGIIRRHLGDLEESVSRHREAVRIFRLQELTDTRTGARVLLSLGNTLIEKGEFDKAEDILQEALQINRRIHGDKYLDTGLVTRALATLHRNRGDFDSSELLYEESLAILREAIGERHVMVGQVLQEQGDLYVEAEAHLRAEEAFRESLTIFESIERIHPQRIVTTRRKLGSALVKLRQFEEAEGLLLESLSGAKIMAGEDEAHQQLVAQVFEELVNLYTEWSKPETALEFTNQLSHFRR